MEQQYTNVLLVDFMNICFTLHHRNVADLTWEFLSSIRTIMTELEINKVVLVVDKGQSTYRLKRYPEYKSARRALREKEKLENPKSAEAREEMYEEANKLVRLAPIFGFQVLSRDGIEADDLISFIVQTTDLTTHRIATVSSDTDLFQLIRPNVIQRSMATDMKMKPLDITLPPKVWVNLHRFMEVYQIEPAQWPLVKSMAGDTADSITSIDKLGEKFSLQLVQKYGSFDEIKRVAKAGELEIKRLSKAVKEALADDATYDIFDRNMELINLLYSQEVKDEMFPANVQEYLLGEIDKFKDTPVLNDEVIQDLMFKSGKVNLYYGYEDWAKLMRGIHN